MAKSSELLALRGKVAGKSFYAMKGVEGTLVRSINEGMSNRVKNDAAYANTRLNAAEFGSAGSMAGAVIRTVSKRWRTILQAFATAQLTKAVRNIIIRDTTHPWGERVLSTSDWPEEIRDAVSRLVKNSYLENFANGIVAIASAIGQAVTVNITTTAQDSDALVSLGADGVRYEFYRQMIVSPSFVNGKYTAPVATVEFINSIDTVIGTPVTQTLSGTPLLTGEENDIMESVIVVALPTRTVNGETYVLQELCSCEWLPISVGA